MVEKDREIRVTNRSFGVVGYTIPELNGLRRQFQHGETKRVPFSELEKLSWMPGGAYLLRNELVVHDEEAVKELLHGVEPEYYYTEKEVRTLLTNSPLDQFLDCLDFAPQGVLDLVKKLAVEIPCNDVQKRAYIEQKLGFNVTKAISLKEEAEEEKEEVSTSKRRAAPVTEQTSQQEPASTGRRYTVKK